MAIDRRNATSSWSGYNHQGKVGIFLAISKLKELILSGGDINNLSLVFEKNNGEDVEICCPNSVVSIHQVKAKKNGKYPNDYRNIREDPSGYQTSGTTNQNRFLHVICEVKGWDVDNKETFKKEYHSARYSPNNNKVQLYTYPNKKKYCELVGEGNKSPIDEFCKQDIKEILNHLKHSSRNDTDHIEETLLEIKDLISKRISEAHSGDSGDYPVIKINEIYDIIISQEKRQKQAIRRAKSLFEMFWNKNIDESVDGNLFAKILNLSDEQFESLIIDLHPQKSIEKSKESNLIDSLLDEDIFEEIFYEFYKKIDQGFFDIPELRYNSTQSSYRLSLINKKYKHGEVSNLIQSIMNNKSFLKASFHVDYLINGRINAPFFENQQISTELYNPYNQLPSERDNLFSNHLKFIDIDKTIAKLEGEQYE